MNEWIDKKSPEFASKQKLVAGLSGLNVWLSVCIVQCPAAKSVKCIAFFVDLPALCVLGFRETN